MTVAELIAELKNMDPTRLVVVRSRDMDQQLCGITQNAAYVRKNEKAWHGVAKLQTIPEGTDYTKEDLASDEAEPCVLLYTVS